MQSTMTAARDAAFTAAAALKAKSTAVAAAVVVTTATSLPVSAATILTSVDITAGDFVTVTETLLPGDDAEFRFTNIDSVDLDISNIALAGTGNNSGSDVGNITFGLTSPTTSGFTSVVTFGTTASATGLISGFSLAAGDTFSIFWDDGLVNPVGVTSSFSTTEATTVIPLPAAGLMLAGALGALGILRRKRAS